jgi:hypothetical protein
MAGGRVAFWQHGRTGVLTEIGAMETCYEDNNNEFHRFETFCDCARERYIVFFVWMHKRYVFGFII